MKKMIVLISLLCGAFFMSAQQSNQQQRPPERWKPESTEWYYPVPPKVKPGVGTGAPSDAIILFDGKDLSMWESAGKDGGPAKWTVKDGAMIVASGPDRSGQKIILEIASYISSSRPLHRERIIHYR